jgi:transposase
MEALLANPETALPADVPALQELVRQLLDEVRRLRQDNAQLRHRLDQALRQHFGTASERSRQRRGRVPRCDGDDVAAATRPGHGRQSLPDHLPRERVVYDLAEAEKPCPCCGQPRVCLGEQVSEQLDYRPASYFVIQHVKKTYACRSCTGPSAQRFQTAGPSVVGPIPKGLAGPGLLAHLVACKYADHLPLYRLEGIVARSGFRLSHSTLCDWMASSADLLAPLVLLMQQRILQSRVIHSDDTPVPFQVPGREQASTGHLWVYIGDAQHPYTLFDFTTHYRRDGPAGILQGYTGYLQADALAQYEGLYATGQVKHVACWAHARRKFVEAQGSDAANAEAALAFIGRLYTVEKDLRRITATAATEGLRQQQRHAQATPILEEFRDWLDQQSRQALPKSPLRQAVQYVLTNWEALGRYREQAYLSIDNNLSERTLRQVALGRKNWLFCGSAAGGHTAAVLYSVVGTCKHLGLDPFAYLREALPGLSALGDKPGEEGLAYWLPDVWQQRQRQDAESSRPSPGASP